jgi:hypothetical protein
VLAPLLPSDESSATVAAAAAAAAAAEGAVSAAEGVAPPEPCVLGLLPACAAAAPAVAQLLVPPCLASVQLAHAGAPAAVAAAGGACGCRA